METIKNYLDNMFINLPKTAQLQTLKEDLYSNMEDKYNELKRSGKSENEAIGIVISEFGNIDEIVKELDIEIPSSNTQKDTENTNNYPLVTKETAQDFIQAQKRYGNLIALGVMLCIMAPTILIFTAPFVQSKTISKDATVLFMIPFFLIIAVAVGIFIFCNLKLEQYEYIKQPVSLPLGLKETLMEQKREYTPSFAIQIIIGVSLCILSPLCVILVCYRHTKNIILDSFGVVSLLLLIAIAVFLFIRADFVMKSYKMLIQENSYSTESKLQERSFSHIASIFWSIVTAGYLLWSFITQGWSYTWIVWPVTGVLFGAFSGIYKAIKGFK